ncbi:imidazolonepropionase [Roseivirga sp. BDSF3-8]|uniref:imidazolonepropionase n=1 Tax=Roseivirga sp. BDSF3-8 TaxID=3241598 RepID=UPI003531FCD6
MDLLIKNISQLLQTYRQTPPARLSGSQMADVPSVDNAWLLIRQGKIEDWGEMSNCPSFEGEVIDATGRLVFPGFVDSHTHIVFAAPREQEFVDRIRGLSYEEIAKKGGGILNSAGRLRETSEDDLFHSAMQRVKEVTAQGTVAIEVKSGYGLTTESELKMLKVIRRLKDALDMPVKSTFLGAHAIPAEYKEDRQGYIDLILNDMLPAVAKEGLADYVDVFCEKGFFTPEETKAVVQKGKELGMKPKIHANQLHRSGGVQTGVETGALSVDHLEEMGEQEINALKGSDTIATLLPGAAFFINTPYPPARDMLNAGLTLALASDYNPGSAPSGNMQLMMSLACVKMRMTPQEALNAATVNAAAAMEIESTHGTITPGKAGSVVITKPVSSLAYLPYSFGTNLVEHTVINGKVV